MLRHGSDAPPAAAIPLKAGPLEMVFEPDGAFLRYVRLGRREILRGVYAAVRDQNWDTIDPRVSGVELREGADGFVLTFAAECRGGGVDFGWRGRIEGRADGRLRFGFAGEARGDFRRNRIGFCVLHPPACAGAEARVTRSDGSKGEGFFPVEISPHQPFMDMAAVAYRVEGDVWAEVRLEGDVFEMEDQRNWTDASYKTYCTPLALPFPVDISAGERVEQAVELRLSGDLPAPGGAEDGPVRFVAGEAVPLPPLGLGCAGHGRRLSAREIDLLRALNLEHLRVDLRLADAGYAEALERAAAEARDLGVRLQAALFVDENAEEQLRGLTARLAESRPPVGAWLLFHESEKSTARRWVETARKILGAYDAAIPLGAGSDAYFTELNRERPPADAVDFVSYSINPQVHAFDDASLVETLEAQALTVGSARLFAAGKEVQVGPVTLQPRFNPNATGPAAPLPPGELPPQVDPRQLSLLGAGWTLGSAKHLSAGGADRVTYFETSGWRGVMQGEAAPPLPDKFPAAAGAVFPLYHVLADIGEYAGGRLVPLATGQPLRAEALALERAGRRRVLVANLGPGECAVELEVEGGSGRLRLLDDGRADALSDPESFRAEAGRRVEWDGVLPLRLPPYAVARLDIDTEKETP